MPKPGTSLGTILLVHFLTRKIWDAAWFEEVLEQPDASNSQPDLSSACPIYLARISSYTNWRNKTCDSLDVLHWDALGTSATLGGREDVVFLHLHLSRLMILTPMRELLAYFSASISPTAPLNGPFIPPDLYDNCLSKKHCGRIISTWVHNDRYKARLAVVHAGATFWHVRRYSTESFAQPLAVYLASITLWAFANACRAARTSPSQIQTPEIDTRIRTWVSGAERRANEEDIDVDKSPMQASFEGSHYNISSAVDGAYHGSTMYQSCAGDAGDNPSAATPDERRKYRRRMPRQMQMDRPVDDELVQHFIRFGQDMTVSLEGISDICSETGATLVLKEGVVILDSLAGAWPIAANYKHALEAFLQSN